VDFERPDFGDPSFITQPGTFSNLYNTLTFNPLPWASLVVDTQFPVFDKGFTQVNTSLNFQVTKNFTFNIGQRYINNDPEFVNSDLVTCGAYYRINDNWAFSFAEQYEFQTHLLEGQTYQINRDLSSWIASLGFLFENNGGGNTSLGLILTFTLKDLPSVRLPLSIDPSALGGLSGNQK